ncbi:uncharacterized protein DUF4011 [Rhizobium sp. PP-WC-2G-219]|nr:uncharacterized protein DUF4011 [Rhizobium sp. PP-WC-2G-219]
MTFLAGAKGREVKSEDGTEEELIELALPDDDDRDESGRLVRHADTKLQTRMTPAALQKRLLDLDFDARTLEEEQGVNILFLGLGTLKWIDPKNPATPSSSPSTPVLSSVMEISCSGLARPSLFATEAWSPRPACAVSRCCRRWKSTRA